MSKEKIPEENLKLCPFCGGHPFLMSVPYDSSFSITPYWLECNYCHMKTKSFADDLGPIKAWNTRVSDEF